jgi:hypothetical protein
MQEQVLDFISVCFIFWMVMFPKDFIIVSGTVLGKLIAILIIVYFTREDWVYGLFACACILYYYQSDTVVRVLNHTLWENGYEPFSTFPKYGGDDEIETPLLYSFFQTYDANDENLFKYTSSPQTGDEAETQLSIVDTHHVLKSYFAKDRSNPGKEEEDNHENNYDERMKELQQLVG